MSFPEAGVWGVVWALGPTVCVGLIFWFVMRSIIRADRTERAVQAKIEAEYAAAHGELDPRGVAKSHTD